MFDAAELSHRIAPGRYRENAPTLRAALLNAQLESVRAARFSTAVVVAGVAGAGRREVVHLLNEWLDPRHADTHGMGRLTDEEASRPRMWRYWRVIPPKGRIGLFLGSWYTEPLLGRAFGGLGKRAFFDRLEEINRFERMMSSEGVLVVKLWLHLTRKQQKKRLKKLERDDKTRWRVSKRDWDQYRHYDDLHAAAGAILRVTSTAEAPWMVVSGEDARYRSLTIAQTVFEAMQARLEQRELAAPTNILPMPAAPKLDGMQPLRALDLSVSLPKERYAETLEALQGRLGRLTSGRKFGARALVAVFEGNDAAGKGGAIRRLTQALDPQRYKVIPVAAPSDEERARPYLWRFWRRIPAHGQIAIFDRSWYGRLLVERVEGFCAQHDWMRAFGEINDFEASLARDGVVVVKFWLAISNQEQLRRFEERQNVAYKRHKITDEDWRNREKWETYESAVCDMIDRTGTDVAPWTLVEANDKRHARVKILRALCRRLENALR